MALVIVVVGAMELSQLLGLVESGGLIDGHLFRACISLREDRAAQAVSCHGRGGYYLLLHHPNILDPQLVLSRTTSPSSRV